MYTRRSMARGVVPPNGESLLVASTHTPPTPAHDVPWQNLQVFFPYRRVVIHASPSSSASSQARPPRVVARASTTTTAMHCTMMTPAFTARTACHATTTTPTTPMMVPLSMPMTRHRGSSFASKPTRAQGGVRAAHRAHASSGDADGERPPATPPALGETAFVAETKLPTDRGFYRVRAYRHANPLTGEVTEPVCLVYGEVEGQSDVPVRVHDACFTSEVLGSLKCDCKQQLELAMDYIKENGRGGIVCYLQQEGRGIGLANKIAAYAVQETGVDTVDANRQLGLPDDTREYSAVENMLRELNVQSIQLMTNNPRKIRELECAGVKITGRIPCIVKANLFNEGYLAAKERRMSHVLDNSWCYWDAAGTVYNSIDEAMEGDYGDGTYDECDVVITKNRRFD